MNPGIHTGLAAGMGAGDRFLPVLALSLLLAVGISLLLRRFRIPVLPGYFVCGFLLSLSGQLDLSAGAPAAHLLSTMANVGIILLMFTIGAETSLHELIQLRRTGLVTGGLQMGLTTALVFPVTLALGLSAGPALLTAFIVALSSTAVGLKLFQDFSMGNHPGARMTLGIALFQDVAVILLLVILPGLTGGAGLTNTAGTLLAVAGKGLVFLLVAGLLSRFGIPRLLRVVSQSRSRELFTLTVLALCAGIASLGNLLGLNAALGAFAAGLAVSGSVYSHRILADAATFRDFFLTIFFVSIGAFVDIPFLMTHWLALLGGGLAILLLKAGVLTLAGHLAGVPLRGGILAGIALSGVGEFAVVVADQAVAGGLLDPAVRQVLLIETVLTLGLSPLLMRAAVPFTRKFEHLRASRKRQEAASGGGFGSRIRQMNAHAILCGYGTVGRMVHEALLELDIPVIIIELNPVTVRRLVKAGHAVLFADISQADTLELAGIERARVIAITFPHPELARTAMTVARERNPDITVLCRARFPAEVELLRATAPEGIVHDEREAGLQMLRLCLSAYDRDESEITLVESRVEAVDDSLAPDAPL